MAHTPALILSSEPVNEWIQLLETIGSEKAPVGVPLLDLQLRSFSIQGPGKNPTNLSHPSVLLVHQLVNWNPLMKHVLENVCLQDQRDSDSDLLPDSFRP